MASKKITDFADGGSFDVDDAILIARGGKNYFIKGGLVPNTTDVANAVSLASNAIIQIETASLVISNVAAQSANAISLASNAVSLASNTATDVAGFSDRIANAEVAAVTAAAEVANTASQAANALVQVSGYSDQIANAVLAAQNASSLANTTATLVGGFDARITNAETLSANASEITAQAVAQIDAFVALVNDANAATEAAATLAANAVTQAIRAETKVDLAISQSANAALMASNAASDAASAVTQVSSLQANVTSAIGRIDALASNAIVTSGTIANLSAVARTGSYADLLNPPSIPTTLSSFTNDLGFLTAADLPEGSGNSDIDLSALTGRVGVLETNAVATANTIADLAVQISAANAVASSAQLLASNASGAASNAATLASNASTLASNASIKADAALNSAANAATQAATAFTQATNAVSTASNASTLASTATVLASNAAATASNASAVASNASVVANSALSGAANAVTLAASANAAVSALQANVAGLAAVARSGFYADLLNPPVIPVVPTKLSGFLNDLGFLTAADLPSGSGDASSGGISIGFTTLVRTEAYALVDGVWNDLPWMAEDAASSGLWDSANPARVTIPNHVGYVRFLLSGAVARSGTKAFRILDKAGNTIGSVSNASDPGFPVSVYTRWLPVAQGDYFTTQMYGGYGPLVFQEGPAYVQIEVADALPIGSGSTGNSVIDVSILTSRVDALEDNALVTANTITSFSAQIANTTVLASNTANALSTLQANVVALSQKGYDDTVLSGRVTSLEGTSGQQASAITNITGRVGTLESDFDLLDARVALVSSTLTTAASRISDLEAAPSSGSGSTGGTVETKARFWRLRFLTNGGGSTVEVGEVQFRGVPGGPTLTTGGTAFADSFYASGSYGPENAFDGNPGNQWSYAAGVVPANAYIGYQFADAVNVREVAITAPGEGPSYAPRAAWLEASVDGVAYREVMSFICSDWNVTPTQVFTVPQIGFAASGSGSYDDTALTGRVTALEANATMGANLATVATSGSYADLLNKPVIPTLLGQLFNDAGFITGYTIPDTGVAPGLYTNANIIVGSDGRITGASNGTASSGGSGSGSTGQSAQKLVSLNRVNNYESPGGWGSIPWDQLVLDEVGAWNSAAPERITIPAGYTKVKFVVYTVFQYSSGKYVRLNKNGDCIQNMLYNGVSESGMSMVTRWIPVVAGQYFDVMIHNNSGALGGPVFGGPSYIEVTFA